MLARDAIGARVVGWFSKRASEPPRQEPTLPARPRNAVGLNTPGWLESAGDGELTAFLRGSADNGSFGPHITETSSMRVSAVYACVTLAAGMVSSAPLGVYSETPEKGRVLAFGNRLNRLLSLAPYPGRPMTSSTWRYLWVTHVWLWGNHFSIIRFDGAGRVYGFEPVDPWRVDIVRNPDGSNTYIVNHPNATREAVPQDEMLHFSGPSFDGIRGVSRIAMFARDAVALAAVMEEQTGRVHENASRPSGMLTLPPTITPAGKRRIEADWNDRQAGRVNAGRVLFADKDSQYTPFQMSSEDLNTIEARRYQTSDICRFFLTPPHMIGEAANTSAWGTGIEQLTLGYRQSTIHPLLVDFEQELQIKLFTPASDYYPMFDRAALIVMDAKTQADVAQTEIQSGVRTINERRSQLNLPASTVDGANEPLVNATMIPLSRAMNPPTPPATSATPPADPAPAKKDPAK